MKHFQTRLSSTGKRTSIETLMEELKFFVTEKYQFENLHKSVSVAFSGCIELSEF